MKSVEEFCEIVAKGNEDAKRFCIGWLTISHKLDDIIDNPDVTKEQVIHTFLYATSFFGSDPFFMGHWHFLQPVNILSANAYADSVAWENSDKPYRKNIADVLRSYGNEMLCMVAFIVGGLEHMRSISLELRERSYATHHNEKGEAK